jgi:glutathione synthase/RimK-type ligase-like ATP-grasp enzyme
LQRTSFTCAVSVLERMRLPNFDLTMWNTVSTFEPLARTSPGDGVRIVPTVWARRGEDFNLVCCEQHGFRDVVIKPARGAATHDVLLVHRDDDTLAEGQGHLDRLLREHDGLVQPYLDSVMSYGERALVFFENRFSHAVIKKPFDKVLAVGGSASPAAEATLDEIELATKALTMAPGRSM